MSGRIVCWFSAGAASAVATKLVLLSDTAARNRGASPPEVVVAYCHTGAEDPDNARFLADCEQWFGVPINILRSTEYADVWECWEKRRYIAGVAGAPCSGAMKFAPRLDFQRPSDTHVFGYTADKRDAARATKMRETYPELSIMTPLIARGLTKANVLGWLESHRVKPPLTYALGFPNANCIPCGKATSPGYWALIRKHYPEQFARFVELSRRLGVRNLEIHKQRLFVDELPDDWPILNPIAPACDFLCHMAEAA